MRRLIFISNINAKLKKPGLYGRSKREAEKTVEGSKLDWAILHPTLIYGKESITFERMVAMMKKTPFIPLFGPAQFLIQPVFVDDVVLAIDKVRENKRCYGKIYEIGGKEAITFEEMVDLIAKNLGVSKPKIHSVRVAKGYHGFTRGGISCGGDTVQW